MISPVVVNVETWLTGVMYSRKSRREARGERNMILERCYQNIMVMHGVTSSSIGGNWLKEKRWGKFCIDFGERVKRSYGDWEVAGGRK